MRMGSGFEATNLEDTYHDVFCDVDPDYYDFMPCGELAYEELSTILDQTWKSDNRILERLHALRQDCQNNGIPVPEYLSEGIEDLETCVTNKPTDAFKQFFGSFPTWKQLEAQVFCGNTEGTIELLFDRFLCTDDISEWNPNQHSPTNIRQMLVDIGLESHHLDDATVNTTPRFITLKWDASHPVVPLLAPYVCASQAVRYHSEMLKYQRSPIVDGTDATRPEWMFPNELSATVPPATLNEVHGLRKVLKQIVYDDDNHLPFKEWEKAYEHNAFMFNKINDLLRAAGTVIDNNMKEISLRDPTYPALVHELGKARNMGTEEVVLAPANDPHLRACLCDVQQMFPSDWWETSTPFRVIRENYSDLGVEGRYYRFGPDDNSDHPAIVVTEKKNPSRKNPPKSGIGRWGRSHIILTHELGHHFESLSPLILEISNTLWEQTTKGYEPVRAKSDRTFIYPDAAHHVNYDEYATATRPGSLEIFACGLHILMARASMNMGWHESTDYQKWVLGTLAAA